MKKINYLLICFIIILLLPNTVFASTNIEQDDWQDIILSDEEFEQLLSQNSTDEIIPFASSLISSKSISISKKDDSLIIIGLTECNSTVTKCGFSKVTIQRRKNSSATWSSYKTYTDLYTSSSKYRLTKSISVPTGYQYRVTCTHYAKNSTKSQTINNTSNTLTF